MNNPHRIFIAVNLPSDIKKQLFSYSEKWPEIPARWTNLDNLHITLVFVGDVEEEQVSEIRDIIKEAVLQHKAFSINLEKISYGPPNIIPPRMIWAVGERSDNFVSLKDNIEKKLLKVPKFFFKPEIRDAIPHITLARIKEWEWRRIEPEERPEMGEYLGLKIPVDSIKLMESRLKREGAEYAILESYKLI